MLALGDHLSVLAVKENYLKAADNYKQPIEKDHQPTASHGSLAGMGKYCEAAGVLCVALALSLAALFLAGGCCNGRRIKGIDRLTLGVLGAIAFGLCFWCCWFCLIVIDGH